MYLSKISLIDSKTDVLYVDNYRKNRRRNDIIYRFNLWRIIEIAKYGICEETKEMINILLHVDYTACEFWSVVSRAD